MPDSSTKRPTKVYVSGRISGLPEDEYIFNFQRWSDHLRNEGFTPVNPLEVVPECPQACESELTFNDGTYQHTWQCYMKYDILALMECDAIFAMPNAAQSKGAITELMVANALGLPVITIDAEGNLEW